MVLKLEYDRRRGLYSICDNNGKCHCVFRDREVIYEWLLLNSYVAIKPDSQLEQPKEFIKAVPDLSSAFKTIELAREDRDYEKFNTPIGERKINTI